MKIKSLKIEGIGGIKNLHVEFDANMNIICGPNGIGKTTILECIAHSFSTQNSNILKRNVSSHSGSFQSIIDIDGQEFSSNININDFTPDKASRINGLHQHANKLLSLKVNRSFEYQSLNAVGKDIDKDAYSMYQEAKSGINIHEVKNWFVNRYLYSAHEGALTEAQIHNLNLAKKCFSLLNDDFSFSKVLASSNEIMINTPNGEIYYEYLSSGFKSCLSIIFGIIKDIEFRFKNAEIKADDFDGIILVDELELHLHPEWQAKIADILVEVFPAVQFITSTHSPHILQNAKPNQIVALSVDNGNVFSRKLEFNEYGFQGWTVEEVLMDVMGMVDTKTELYQCKLLEFETAIKMNDYHIASLAFNDLDALLHPENILRKLLKFELASISEAK
ncbi:AAA family ATPase [Photobacterium swingsii]|uniref:AAA family ATPase n=1 Tax=Photobacterium swingsii TaxID=680026 RepID=UPI003D0E78D8